MTDVLELLESIALTLTFLSLGAASLLVAFLLRRRTRRFVERSAEALGRVVALQEEPGEGGVLYAPVIRYTDEGGTEREFRHGTASRPAAHDVGDTVRLLYSREEPADARVATTGSLYLGAIIFALIGAAFFIVGLTVPAWRMLGD